MAETKGADLGGITILVMDPDKGFAENLRRELSSFGATVYSAGNAEEAGNIFGRFETNALLASLEAMDEHSEEFIRKYKDANPDGMFFLVIEPDTTVTSTDPSGLVVEDYLQKPIDTKKLAYMLETGASRALATLDPLVEKARPYFQFRSESMRRALFEMPRIAASNQTVLISGETGSGKEIISRALHVMSPRKDGPFVALNCGAVPEGLIEGELFGHEKGAFTGALNLRKGKFETATGGTILLDEIGEMSLHLQVRLLRVLEDKHLYRIGGEKPVPIDARVIASTNRNLRQAVRDGLFREDLYYRLNILQLHLPPLRERIEDISFLAVHFMNRALDEIGHEHPFPKLSSAAIEMLESLKWQGNVRELRNVMTRVAVFLPSGAKQVLPMHVLPHLEASAEPSSETQASVNKGVLIPENATLSEAEEILIRHALSVTGGNRTKAAKLLGIGIRTLRRRLNE